MLKAAAVGPEAVAAAALERVLVPEEAGPEAVAAVATERVLVPEEAGPAAVATVATVAPERVLVPAAQPASDRALALLWAPVRMHPWDQVPMLRWDPVPMPRSEPARVLPRHRVLMTVSEPERGRLMATAPAMAPATKGWDRKMAPVTEPAHKSKRSNL
jgi:hypothetical protein